MPKKSRQSRQSTTPRLDDFAIAIMAAGKGTRLKSKHLKVLERAGLIARGREAQWRPCRIEAKPLKQAADWISHYERFWTESFDRLDAYLQKLKKQNSSQHSSQNTSTKRKSHGHHSRTKKK